MIVRINQQVNRFIKNTRFNHPIMWTFIHPFWFLKPGRGLPSVVWTTQPNAGAPGWNHCLGGRARRWHQCGLRLRCRGWNRLRSLWKKSWICGDNFGYLGFGRCHLDNFRYSMAIMGKMIKHDILGPIFRQGTGIENCHLGAKFRPLHWGPAVIDGSFQASCAFQNLEVLELSRSLVGT